MTSGAPDGTASGTAQHVSYNANAAAPPRTLLSYDELLDARQIARAMQGSWRDQYASGTSLACLWPFNQPAAGDLEDDSENTQRLAQHTAHTVDLWENLQSRPDQPCSTHEAGLQQAKYHRRPAAPKLKGQQRPITDSLQDARTHRNSSNLQQGDSDTSTNDSVHTAHFSDEGELSDADTMAKQPHLSAKHGDIKQGPVMLYSGPNSKELAASRAASKPPSGPRPQLGDVLLEAIHSDDVKTSCQATGALEEPLPRDKWHCIMRLRRVDGQVVECGYDNLWYMRQCVKCDATHGATELTARVSAILQTSDSSSISAHQVMNRLKAFSSSPGGLSHAFTMDMVQQAINDWSRAQGHETACSSGPSGQNQRAETVSLLSFAQDQEQVRAAADYKPAVSIINTAPSQQAFPVDQQWGRSAAALQQALTTLATSQPTKRPRTCSSHAPFQPSLGIPQAQHPSSATAQAPADALAVPSNPEDLHTANGSALHEGAPPGLHAAIAEGTDNAASQSGQVRLQHVAAHDALGTGTGLSEQGTSGQALHFAHDLLDAVMRQQHKHAKSSKKRDAVGQWVQVRRPSAYGTTRAEMHRKVFQLPALPKHQPKLQSWQRPPTPTLSIWYPPAPAQASPPPAQAPHQHDHQVHTQQLAEDIGPTAIQEPMAGAAETGTLDDTAAETFEAQEELVTCAQEASLQHHPAATTEEGKEVAAAANEAAGGAASAEAAYPGTGLVEEPYYGNARGLKPSPVARALAGPTVHILLEGYDVYTDSGMKRKGNDFPLQEVLHVSQDSRQLWLNQRPFKLKRGMPQDVAEGVHRRGGWRQKQGSKVNTKQIALDRQQANEAPCSIGASGHSSAFQPFSGPSTLPLVPTGPTSGASQQPDRAVAPNGQPSDAQSHEAAAREEQLVCSQRNSNAAVAVVPGQEHSASVQASQSRDEGTADVQSPDGTRAGPSEAVLGVVGAANTGSLEAASDTAMAEQFRDMGGDAWKVFYMASKMGLRPDIIEKAANRFRSLQQHSE